MFDTDCSGSIDFKEVAYGLYKLSEDMESSSKAAFELLLMLDKDDTRELGYEQFTKLILNIAAAGDMKFGDIADALTISAAKRTPLSDEDLALLIVADEIYNAASDIARAIEEELEVDDALCYAKMHKLFDLWDENGDGSINYEELLVGLRKFQGAEDMDESITSAAVMMLATDREGNQTLDREEFARALVKYAKALGVEDFHAFIDFLVVVTVLQDDDENERAYISSIGDIATTEIAIIQGLAQAIGEND
jgi:Ca2+-binding EF-hand superfamily protein